MPRMDTIMFVEGPTSATAAAKRVKANLLKGTHVTCQAHEIKGEPYEWLCKISVSHKQTLDVR